jgi:uncharacterized protein (DUF1697 family)
MTAYVSILRGINVGGRNIIHMDALQKMYENLGFHSVTAYLQSGNVIFVDADIEVAQLEQKISSRIKRDFGLDVPVIVMTIDVLKQVVDNNPFFKDPDKDQRFLHVTFLSATPNYYDSKTIEDKRQRGEEISFTDSAAYLYCPHGYGKTRLTNNFLEAKLKVVATTRNWKTANELLKIANQSVPFK